MSKIKKVKAAVLSTVVGAMSPLAMVVPASAAEVFWTGSINTNITTPGNWGGGVAPSSTDDAVFTADTPSKLAVEVPTGGGAVELNKIIFDGEVPTTSSRTYTISGGALGLASGITAAMTGAGGDHNINTSITLLDDASFETDGVDMLTVGDDDTVLNLADNALTLTAAGGTITIQGIIDGKGSVEITEGMVNMLAVPGENFDAVTTVSGGEFVVSETTEGDVTVDGGVLKGESGDTGLLGTVTLNSGSIEPGMSPGCLNVSELVLTGGTYEVELNGTTRCTEYDSTSVTDDVSIGDGVVTLDIKRLTSFEPAVDDVFAIITYSEDSDVTGYFEGLEDGDTVTLAEYTYEINYDDDDAVTLTVLGTPEAPYTGLGSLLNSPLLTLGAAAAVLLALGAARYAQAKKIQK